MRKLVIVFLLLVSFVSLTAAGVLGYLFYREYDKNEDLETENKKYADEGESADEEYDESDIEVAEDCVLEDLVFSDIGMGAEVTYPADWIPVLEVNMSDDFIYDEATSLYGPIADTYELTFSKDSAVINFTKILGGVGGVIFPLNSATHNYEIFEDTVIPLSSGETTNLVRCQEVGWDNWVYVPLGDCTDLPTGDTSDINVCVDPFFPGFGNAHFAASATVTGATGDLLAEADEIVKSAVRE